MELRARGLITLPTQPGAFSDAAWHIVAGMIAKHGDIRIPNVCVHPQKTTLLKYLILTGAPIRMDNHRWVGNDPVADFHSLPPKKLFPIRVYPEDMPALIEHLPALMICVGCADGTSFMPYVPQAQPMIELLVSLGVDVVHENDALQITGKPSFTSVCYPRASGQDPLIERALALASLHQKDAKHV